MSKEEIARKIVTYFNKDEMAGGLYKHRGESIPLFIKWDSIMYEQKHVVMGLLNQLNQNKDGQNKINP